MMSSYILDPLLGMQQLQTFRNPKYSLHPCVILLFSSGKHQRAKTFLIYFSTNKQTNNK